MEGDKLSDIPGNSRALGKAKEERIQDDDLYCLQGSFVFFQVERRMFHIPSYRLAKGSHSFAGMLTLSQRDDCSVTEGSSRDNPIILPVNISCNDFRNFLKAFYPLPVSIQLRLSKDEWISVLRLATFWHFHKYRQMAISEIEKGRMFTSVDKIVYGREFKIRSWVIQGYTDLVVRNEAIDKDEAKIIDYDTTFALFGIRDERLRGRPAGTNGLIEEAFKDELDIIEHFEIEYNEVGSEIPSA